MTPLPKKKHTRSRSSIRRNAKKLVLPGLVRCKHCGKLKYSHRECIACGKK